MASLTPTVVRLHMRWSAAEFLEVLDEQVAQLIRNKTVKDEHEGFLYWSLTRYYNLTDIAAREALVYSGSGDGGLDALWLADKRLYIVQAKTSDPLTENATFDDRAMTDLEKVLKAFEFPATISDSRLELAAKKYRQALDDGFSIQFVALISGQPGVKLERATERLVETFGATRKKYRGHHAEVVGEKELNRKFFEELNGKSVGQLEVRIGPSNPRVGYHYYNNDRAAAVYDLEVAEIGKWVQKHDYGIVAKNLRYPLTTAYNEGILETLRDETERKKFWFYHNGLTVICDRLDEIPSDSGDPRIRLVNPQIVNGCQTAFTVKKYLDESPDNEKKIAGTKVMVRIIPVKGQEALGLDGQAIAQYTNSQNAITDRDLRSNDEVQILLQQAFEGHGWFYERKNGEWKARKGPGARAKGGYRHGKVENGTLAQVSLSFWLQKPQESKNQKRQIFRSGPGGFYNKIFRSDEPTIVTPEDLLLPHLVNELLDRWIGEWEDKNPVKRDSPPSLIRKTQVVRHGDLYMLALTGQVLAKKYGLKYLAGAKAPSREALQHLAETVGTSLDRVGRGSGDAFSRRLSAHWGEVVNRLDKYCAAELRKDPETTPRKIFVSPSTYQQQAFKALFNKTWLTDEVKAFPKL